MSNVTPKNLVEFIKALWNDIIGKDANGRDADFKKWYSRIMVYFTLVLTFVLGIVLYPWGFLFGLVFVRKLWLDMTNRF